MDISKLSDLDITALDIAAPNWLLAVSAVIAVLNCFLGYRLLKLWVTLVGFVIGAMIGYFATVEYVNNIGIAILTGLLGGMLIGFLAFRVYLLGVFLISFVLAFSMFLRIPADSETLMLLVLGGGLIVALAVGIAAVKFVRPAVIIITGISGGLGAASDFLMLMKDKEPVHVLGAGVILAVSGILVQFLTTRKEKKM
ncbi:hypothetical protein [Ruminococcus gauvreauii]|uniref:TMEM198/TM7SF3 family protein n=1 Tax=Ruminococcus gauvreauii TaxID=438033 RepID=A0ABY5VF92_9FIRM|nr:hypothetical protein [Ruminococcus gauvreauii]UWP59230.1 TMEM198/TM7SF3 family protein [Ruminococcus gauvreauii]